MEESSNLLKLFEEYLSAPDVENAIKLFNDPQFEDCFKYHSWDLITIISTHLNENVLCNNKILFDCCERFINAVAEKSPPEESLLQIIDQIESLNDVRFSALLMPMLTTVLRTEKKLALSVEWCFNSIHRHLHCLPLPEIGDLEGEERKLLDIDPCVQRISELYMAIIPFYEPFVDKIKVPSNELTVNNKSRDNLKEAVLYSLIRLLGKPVIFMDLEYDGKTKSCIRSVCEKLMNIIYEISPDLISVLEFRDLSNILNDLRKSKEELRTDVEPQDTFSVEDKFSAVSLGVYCYLIFGEEIKLDKLPQVYNPLFMLNKNLYLSAILLKASRSLIQRKGLLLLKGALNRFLDYSIPCKVLDSVNYRHVIEGLYIVAVYCYEKENRQLAVNLIKILLFKFDVNGRYILLVKMVKSVNHSGLTGYLAMLYKDILRDILSKPISETNYYTEKRIIALLEYFCDLPNKSQSDLVELSDQVISCLNLIRFMIIRDSENRTGIKEYVKSLDKTFLKYLREGINLSRAHYKLKLEDVQNERKNRKSMGRSTQILIGKNKVPNLPADEKIFIIQSALNGFDVMESLLGRLNECIGIYV